jgi:RNA recognition motif-containing protein
MAIFQQHYPSVFEARVMTDAATGIHKGFGFVRFANQSERDRAVSEMSGQILHGRSLRVSVAEKRQQARGGFDPRFFTPGITQVCLSPFVAVAASAHVGCKLNYVPAKFLAQTASECTLLSAYQNLVAQKGTMLKSCRCTLTINVG